MSMTSDWPTPLDLNDSPSSPTRGEQALWTAVITQALMDAATGSAKREAQKDKTCALTWLECFDLDFHDVCDLAGLDPSYVHGRAQMALERNCRWRLPAGEGWRGRALTANRHTSPEVA